MSTLKKTLVLGTSSVLALSSMTVGVAVAASADDAPSAAAPAAQEENSAYLKTDIVKTDTVQGDFAFTQNEVSSTAAIKAAANASKYICNATGHLAKDDSVLSEDWKIAIQGAVDSPASFTFEELKESPSVQKMLLACTCMGNPTDGNATANAEVTGVPVSVMLQEVGVQEGANTIVFTSADGYEVSLPLSYVANRYCPIVFDVNGAPIAEVIGGTNQLWLGATSANYFARDIVGITLEERQTPPPSPSSDEAREAYQNLPNIGILLGGEVR